MIGFFKKLFFWIVVCGLLGVAGYYLVSRLVVREKPQPAILGTVEQADLEQRITFAGVIASKRRSIITAPYSGYVKDLLVKVGDRVKKGDPIVSVSASLDSFEPVHPLRAPFAGIVTLIRKLEGEFVKENDAQDYLLRIDDVSKFFVEASVPEIDSLKVKLGQEAIIKSSALSDVVFHGVVRRMSLAPDEKGQGMVFGGKTQVEYQVFIEINDDEGRLKPGMSAIIDVIATSVKQALTLKHEFVFEENGESFVTLENGEKRKVTVGLKNDEAVEIVNGLSLGQRVRQIEFAP